MKSKKKKKKTESRTYWPKRKTFGTKNACEWEDMWGRAGYGEYTGTVPPCQNCKKAENQVASYKQEAWSVRTLQCNVKSFNARIVGSWATK